MIPLPDNLEPVNILAIGYSDEEGDMNCFDEQRILMDKLVSYDEL